MSGKGWIKLHRKLMDNPIFDNPNLLRVWLWCLLKASHDHHQQMIGLQIVDLEPGQFVTGRFKGSDELKINPSTFYKYLKTLEKLKMINLKSNNKMTIVTIENWRKYQVEDAETYQQNNNKISTKEQQNNTNKNDKNVKNDKKDIYIEVFEFWNSKGIIRHKKLTDKMERKIKSALKDYDIDTIKEIISTYAEVVLNDKYWFTHKWTLDEFLQRGITKFENREVALENYLKDEYKREGTSYGKYSGDTREENRGNEGENWAARAGVISL